MNNSHAPRAKLFALVFCFVFASAARAGERCVDKLSSAKAKDVAARFSEITGTPRFGESSWKSTDGSNFSISEVKRETIVKLKGVPEPMLNSLGQAAHLADANGKISLSNMMMLRAVLSAGVIQFNAKLCLDAAKEDQVKMLLTGLGQAKGHSVLINLKKDSSGKVKMTLDMEGHQSEAVFDNY